MFRPRMCIVFRKPKSCWIIIYAQGLWYRRRVGRISEELQHAQALGGLRAMAIEQRKQEMEEARKSGVQPWTSEDFIPFRPV